MWRWALALTVVAGGGGLAACYFLSGEEVAPVVLDGNRAAPEEEDILPEPDIYVPDVKGRKLGLQTFHAEAAMIFAQTPGFGMDRMPAFMRKAAEHVVFLSPGELEKESYYSRQPELKTTNQEFAKAFGAAKGDNRFTGFQLGLRGFLTIPVTQEALDEEQRLQKQPLPQQQQEQGGVAVAARPKLGKTHSMWTVSKVDLVGLIEADNPVVYDSHKILMSNNPTVHFDRETGDVVEKKMEEGPKLEQGPGGKLIPRNARVPDFFELTGIERLRKGDELFVRHKEPTSIRMLGALRATSQCLKCHEDFKEGDLLGALSYTLRMR